MVRDALARVRAAERLLAGDSAEERPIHADDARELIAAELRERFALETNDAPTCGAHAVSGSVSVALREVGRQLRAAKRERRK